MAENRAKSTSQNNDNMQNIIQRDARRRMEQMQQKVPYRRQRNMQPFYRNNNSAYNNSTYKDADADKNKSTENTVNNNSNESSASEGFKMPFGILNGLEKYIEKLDTDKILIIAMLAIIYKDGGNKKLMMALAYLLT